MGGFTFQTTPRSVCEDGAPSGLGAMPGSTASRALVVTDRGLVDAGVVDEALRSFVDAEVPRHTTANPPARRGAHRTRRAAAHGRGVRARS
ncbi:MAG: hypothetical protein JWL60_2572 [Gemmatimonadetes bacterium]|jgi:alcohol dehydrogenase class IV|nr:hypothetical protein [Gemmatimonadota bacterium]